MGVRNFGPSEERAGATNAHLQLVTPLEGKLVKQVDESIELSCCIDGQPRVQIYWYYNGENLTPNSSRVKIINDSQTLLIRRLDFADAGVYECIARNEAGSLVTACELVVQENPFVQRPRVITELSDVSVRQGGDTMLSCVITCSMDGNDAFGWFREGQLVYEDNKRVWGQVVLRDCTKRVYLKFLNAQPSDSGLYECRLISLFGGPLSTFANVYVTD